ncbi:MAG TPA: hypothetical protein VMC42_07170 [Methanoregulaceae archaeon]|nr:hypothetical protein [Methanoregulaceae archaeon]
MKMHLYYAILLCIICTGCFLAPVSAVVAGNSTNNVPVYPVKQITPAAHTTLPPVLVSETAGPLNLPVPAIILVAGVIIILIAIGGLVWRYLHPKYIPPEDPEK